MKVKSWFKDRIGGLKAIPVIFKITILVCFLTLICAASYGLYVYISNEPVREKQRQELGLQQMAQIGIDKPGDLNVISLYDNSPRAKGSFVIYRKSFDPSQGILYVGFKANDDITYVLNIPISKVVYSMNETEESLVEVELDGWDDSQDVITNVENHLQVMKITIAPEQFNQIVVFD